MEKILIDFVAGTHGHFLEIVLNQGFGSATDLTDPFTELGASHKKSAEYQKHKLFYADHWSEHKHDLIKIANKIISIKFSMEDLLVVSSVSLLRAGDMNIDNDSLEHNTYNKLNNGYYKNMLDSILCAYPDLQVNKVNSSIPRNILREFNKFGFRDPKINGYWLKLQQLTYSTDQDVFYFDFENFYDEQKFTIALKKLQDFVGQKFCFDHKITHLHQKFLNLNPYKDHKILCDKIIQQIKHNEDCSIPPLTLFQESYINAKLELEYNKEMPFHDLNYFTSTKDVLNYIETRAPLL
jgi:hypothetical protein